MKPNNICHDKCEVFNPTVLLWYVYGRINEPWSQSQGCSNFSANNDPVINECLINTELSKYL